MLSLVRYTSNYQNIKQKKVNAEDKRRLEDFQEKSRGI